MKRLLMVVLVLSALLLAACGGEPTSVPPTVLPTQAPVDTPFDSPLDMPNPASQFCEDQGYELEIREEAGGQVGYCLFPDGTECEEWAFFRGECGPENQPFDSPLDMPNPASQFCEEQGYTLEMRTDDAGTTGYCIFDDGTECEEWAFFRGECGPGTP